MDKNPRDIVPIGDKPTNKTTILGIDSSMTQTGWIITSAIAVATLLLCVLLWSALARYVNLVLQTPKWFVVVCFILFPPAFVAFVIGLIPYKRSVEKEFNEIRDGAIETFWNKNPPSPHIKGDERTRRLIAIKRRQLGYED